ncbi:MAG: efflux RND transporter periplasmic adaptor subunit [Calditrichaceae bacterium]
MKKVSVSLIWIILILLTGCGQDNEGSKKTAVPVQVYQIRPDSISTTIETTGNLEAMNDAFVYSQVSEKLDKIIKPVGSKIKKDEIIAVLENKIWKQSMKQAEASYQSMQARYDQVKQDYDRYQRLYSEMAVSEQQWEKTGSALQESEATLAQLRAAYEQAKEQFENTYIKAPFDGVVGSLLFELGQMVPAGQPVAKIINTDLMRAKLNISDIFMNKLKLGQTVYAEFPPLPGNIYSGTITRINPAIDAISRTAETEAIFDNIRRELKSGMYGQFSIEIEMRKNTFVIPDNALIRRTEVKVDPNTGQTYTHQRFYVFVAESDTAGLVEVKTGLQENSRIEITDGLKKDDRVIVVGQQIVKEGQEVNIITQ